MAKFVALCAAWLLEIYRSLPLDDPKHRKPDITLAKELLGWEPKVPLKEGLAKTIEYFRGW